MCDSDSDCTYCPEEDLYVSNSFKEKSLCFDNFNKKNYMLINDIKDRVWKHINKKRFFEKPLIRRYLSKLSSITTTDKALNRTLQKYIRELNLIEQEINGYENLEQQRQSNAVSINLELSEDINGVNNIQESKNILNGNQGRIIPNVVFSECPDDSVGDISASLLSNVDFQYSDPVPISKDTYFKSTYTIYANPGQSNKEVNHSTITATTGGVEALMINDEDAFDDQVNNLNFTSSGNYSGESKNFLCNSNQSNTVVEQSGRIATTKGIDSSMIDDEHTFILNDQEENFNERGFGNYSGKKSTNVLCNGVEISGSTLIDGHLIGTSACLNSCIPEIVVMSSSDSGISSYTSTSSYDVSLIEDSQVSKKRKLSNVEHVIENTPSDFIKPLPFRQKKVKNKTDIAKTFCGKFDDSLFHSSELAEDCLKGMDFMLDEFRNFCIKEIDQIIEEKLKKEMLKNLPKSPVKINPFFFDSEKDEVPPLRVLDKQKRKESVNLEHLSFVYEQMYADLLGSQSNTVQKGDESL